MNSQKEMLACNNGVVNLSPRASCSSFLRGEKNYKIIGRKSGERVSERIERRIYGI